MPLADRASLPPAGSLALAFIGSRPPRLRLPAMMAAAVRSTALSLSLDAGSGGEMVSALLTAPAAPTAPEPPSCSRTAPAPA
ncbi:MAG: hypothetical protein U1F67_21540 [Rubrivivax sp.]